MSDFKIEKGSNTPSVSYTASSGTLLISGKSYLENAREFYDKVITKITPFANSKNFTFEFDFEYVNSSSVVSILEMLKNMKRLSPATQFKIKFHYENGDDDMMSLGESYGRISEMPVEYLEK